MSEETRTHTFPRTGERVTIRRVSPRFLGNVGAAARRRFVEEHGEPVCPTYEVDLAGGATETHEHNETTVIEERWLQDEELQEKWETYHQLTTQLQAHVFEQRMRANIYKGVVDDVPDEWVKEQKYWGIGIPDEKHDLKWEWIWDISGGSWNDILGAMTAMARIMDPVEEAASAAAEIFQRPMERGAGPDDSTDSEADSREI